MKKLHIEGFWMFLLLSLPLISSSQDVLYKKGKGSINVNILNFDGNIIQYNIPGESQTNTYYLGKSELDSLYYQGKSIRFTALVIKTKKAGSRNYLSTELINTFSGKINLDYERISRSARTGFTGGLLFNLRKSDNEYWEEYPGWFHYITYAPHKYFFRAGISFYPFNHSLDREGSTIFSTGFSWLIGSYRRSEYMYNYRPGSHTTATSLMWNVRERIFLGDQFQINTGVEVSVLPFLAFFCPQIGISIGF